MVRFARNRQLATKQRVQQQQRRMGVSSIMIEFYVTSRITRLWVVWSVWESTHTQGRIVMHFSEMREIKCPFANILKPHQFGGLPRNTNDTVSGYRSIKTTPVIWRRSEDENEFITKLNYSHLTRISQGAVIWTLPCLTRTTWSCTLSSFRAESDLHSKCKSIIK